jgi:hypothetical protein
VFSASLTDNSNDTEYAIIRLSLSIDSLDTGMAESLASYKPGADAVADAQEDNIIIVKKNQNT